MSIFGTLAPKIKYNGSYIDLEYSVTNYDFVKTSDIANQDVITGQYTNIFLGNDSEFNVTINLFKYPSPQTAFNTFYGLLFKYVEEFWPHSDGSAITDTTGNAMPFFVSNVRLNRPDPTITDFDQMIITFKSAGYTDVGYSAVPTTTTELQAFKTWTFENAASGSENWNAQGNILERYVTGSQSAWTNSLPIDGGASLYFRCGSGGIWFSQDDVLTFTSGSENTIRFITKNVSDYPDRTYFTLNKNKATDYNYQAVAGVGLTLITPMDGQINQHEIKFTTTENCNAYLTFVNYHNKAGYEQILFDNISLLNNVTTTNLYLGRVTNDDPTEIGQTYETYLVSSLATNTSGQINKITNSTESGSFALTSSLQSNAVSSKMCKVYSLALTSSLQTSAIINTLNTASRFSEQLTSSLDTSTIGNIKNVFITSLTSSLATDTIGTLSTGSTATSSYSITWTERQPIGDSNSQFVTLALDSDGSNIIAGQNYADGATNGRLYISYNSGSTWTEIQPAGNVNANWRVASDSDGSNLIAAANGGRLYTSTNSGSSWTERQPIGNVTGSWTSVKSDSDGSNLIAGNWAGRLYISNNYGVNWAETQPNGNTDYNWGDLSINSDGSNLIAPVNYNGHIFVSSNSGSSWTDSNISADQYAQWKCSDSSDDGSKVVVCSDGGRLYTSTNSGSTWTERQPAGNVNKKWFFVKSSSDGKYLIAGVWNGRLYTSNDYGENWIEQRPAGDINKYWYQCDISGNGKVFIASVWNGRLYTGVLQ